MNWKCKQTAELSIENVNKQLNSNLFGYITAIR